MTGATNAPRPFSRPGISLSSEKRDWKSVSVYSLASGDMVRDLGLITDSWEVPGGLVFVFKSGNQQFYSEGEHVLAFVKV